MTTTLYGEMLKGYEKAGEKAAALYYKGKFFSYKTLKINVDILAEALTYKGVVKGEAVTVCMPNIPEAIYALYAISKIGATAHMVHPLAPCEQLKNFMKKVNSVMLITLNINSKEYAPLASTLRYGIVTVSPANSLGSIKRRIFDFTSRKSILKRADNITDYNSLIKNRKAAGISESSKVYLHSGGTSGEPKVIVLSDSTVNALVSRAPHILGFMPRIEGTFMLAVLPMFHGFGLAMGVHAPLCYGAVSVLMPKFSTKETIDLIKKGRLNYIIGVPALYEALLRREEFNGGSLKNIKVGFVGGDCVSPDLIERFNARMEKWGSEARLFEGYGLTETVTVCNVNLYGASKIGSVGKPLPDIKMLIADENNKPLACGATGEILIGGDTLMDGYLDNPTDTQAAFVEIDGCKYVRTGDAGTVDEDGFLYFKQRIKRIIKISGISVYPSEIENVAASLSPDICAACAIEGKNDKGNTIVELYLVSTAQEKDRPNAEDIKEGILKQLGKYAVPQKVTYLESMPQTLVGKIDVLALTKQVHAG